MGLPHTRHPGLVTRAVLAAPLAALLAAACSVATGGAPRYSAADCAVRPILEAGTGRAVLGAEDLAFDAARGEILVSAYDRRATDAALAQGAPVPEGGLYAVDPVALAHGPTRARPLLPPGAIRGGLRPQGIDIDGNRLAVVNRRLGPDGRLDPVVLLLDLATSPPAVVAIHRAPGFCALNDVAIDGGLLHATLDREDCRRFAPRELLPGARTGRLVRLADEETGTVAEGFRFPNGVLRLPDGRLAVAETRGGGIRLSDGRVLATPGGPDNLTLAADGRIVAAVLPNLVRTLFYLRGWSARAPSRIVRVDPATGAVELLFDDPEGLIFPGASVGLMVGDMLVAGSVLAPGLLVCQRAA